MNILIVDDNRHFLDAFKFLLEEHFSDRYEQLFEANDGAECLNIIKKNTIDIIFMDKEMPIMDGVEATKQIVDKNRNIVVIAVSFHSELEDIKMMIEAGARNYIIKEELTPQLIEAYLNKNFY